MGVTDNEHLTEIINVFLGLFLPLAISFFKGNQWGKRARFMTAVVLSLIVGSLTSLSTHAFVYHTAMSADEWLMNLLIIFSASISSYKLYWEDRPIERKAEKTGPFSTSSTSTV
jgi:hypothetical protein